MFSRQQLRVFTLMAIFLALAQANWFDSHVLDRDIEKKALLSDINSVATGLGGLFGTGTAADSSSSSTSATAKSTSASSTPSDTPTPTPTPSPTSTPTPSSSSKSTDHSTSSSDTTTPTPTPTSSPSTSASVNLVTVVSAVSGSTIISVSSSTDTSSSAKSTNSAGLSTDETSSSGMSPKTKSTVIGVVVGVGGAIVLAGLLVVAWRIWGRKKNEDESDGLMGFRSGSAGHEKLDGVSGAGPANPFQSTLENYHNPAKQVNASSNF